MSDAKRIWNNQSRNDTRAKPRQLHAYTHPRAPHNQPAFALPFVPDTNRRYVKGKHGLADPGEPDAQTSAA